MKKKLLYTIPLIASFMLSSCYTQFAVPRERANDYVVREERYRMARDQERQESIADSSQAYGYDYDDLYGQEEAYDYDGSGDVYITEYDINVLPAVRAYRYSVYTPWYTSSIYRPWHRYGHFRHGFYFDYYSDYYTYAPYDFWYDDYWYGPYGYPTVVVGVFPGYYDPWYPVGYYDPYYYGGGHAYTPSKPRKARSFTTDGSTTRKERRRRVGEGRNTTGTIVSTTPRGGRRPVSVRPVTVKQGRDRDVRKRRSTSVRKGTERYREKRLTRRGERLTDVRRAGKREKRVTRGKARGRYERSYYDMSKKDRLPKRRSELRKTSDRKGGTITKERNTRVKRQKTRAVAPVKKSKSTVKRSSKRRYTKSTQREKSSSYTPRSSGHSPRGSGYRPSAGRSRSSYSPRSSSSGRSGASRSTGGRRASSGRKHR